MSARGLEGWRLPFLLVLSVLVWPAPSALGATAKFLGPNKCTSCHDHDKQAAWALKDTHAKALAQLEDKNAGKYAKAIGLADPYDLKGSCVGCHATVFNGDANAGVSCETCHGAGSEYVEPHQQKGNHERSLTQGLIDTRGSLQVWSKMCVDCHIMRDAKLIASGHKSGADFDVGTGSQKILHWAPTYDFAKLSALGKAAGGGKPAAAPAAGAAAPKPEAKPTSPAPAAAPPAPPPAKPTAAPAAPPPPAPTAKPAPAAAEPPPTPEAKKPTSAPAPATPTVPPPPTAAVVAAPAAPAVAAAPSPTSEIPITIEATPVPTRSSPSEAPPRLRAAEPPAASAAPAAAAAPAAPPSAAPAEKMARPTARRAYPRKTVPHVTPQPAPPVPTPTPTKRPAPQAPPVRAPH